MNKSEGHQIITAEDVMREIERDQKVEPLRVAARRAIDWKERLAAIRAIYQCYSDYGDQDYEGCDPYQFGLDRIWTPIEAQLWQDVRGHANLRMVPQFPVGHYFLDFANPLRKVALEADGAGFHDAAKDLARDQRLWDEHGWKVYRVTGAECFRGRRSPWRFVRDHYAAHGEQPDAAEVREVARDYFMNTSLGVALAIRSIEYRERIDWEFVDLCVESLSSHKRAAFPVGRV